MIPILYDPWTREFAPNGGEKLRDCISCIVTEERNGIYECDFEYPTTGVYFDKIYPGMIIGVTHDEGGGIQPFDIVSYSMPIKGIVTFHAVHVSYRTNYMTVYGNNIQNLDDALALLGQAQPARNGFTYYANFKSDGYMSAADGVPHTVRQLLGGMEGSILDTYGGEYEWDGFNVKLYKSRGKTRDFVLRYGVNLLSCQEDRDCLDSYRYCVPYWNKDEGLVIGSMVDSGYMGIDTLHRCVPLDLTEKFETKPTTSELEAAAADHMRDRRTFDSNITITLDFIRLQDFEGFEDYKGLFECKLCDDIMLMGAGMRVGGYFKIVKTVWDALQDRYLEMELGNLSTTLSEALGITNLTEGKSQSAPQTTSTAFTPQSGTPITGRECYYSIYGNVVTVSVAVGGLPAFTASPIVTLPSGYRPRSRIVAPIANGTLTIDPAGAVSISAGSQSQTYGTITYVAK